MRATDVGDEKVHGGNRILFALFPTGLHNCPDRSSCRMDRKNYERDLRKYSRELRWSS